jgi:hypothetical protein
VETRGIFLVTAALVVMIACSVLAAGWMKTADQAVVATKRCEARHRKRVLDLPRITVGLEIKFQGKAFADTLDLQHVDNPSMKFEPLFEVLQRHRKATSTCDASLVCLDNLLVLETHATVQSDIVNIIVRTAWLAGYDIVIAPPRNNTW